MLIVHLHFLTHDRTQERAWGWAGAGAPYCRAAAKDGGARKVEVRAEGSVSEEDGEAAPLEGTGTGEETGEEEEEEEEGADDEDDDELA